MNVAHIAAGVSLLVSLALAAPALDLGVVTIPITRVETFQPLDTLLHNRIHASTIAVRSAPAVNKDVTYIVKPTIGGTTYSLILDTGSANTWVGAGKAYVKSGTSKSTGNAVSVTYGSGSMSGTEHIDAFKLGGLKVPKQSIGVASSTSGFSDVDGILGVGPVDLTEGTVQNTPQVPTVLNNLYSSKAIRNEVLGVYFKPITDGSTEKSNGEITIGGLNSKRYTGSITYVPLTKTHPYSAYWAIAINGVSYGTSSIGGTSNALVDTGTTLIYLPQSVYNKFLDEAAGETDSATGLATFKKKPTKNLVIIIAGKHFPLTPDQFLIPQNQYDNFGLKHGVYYARVNKISGDIDFIIGQKFLENYYSVYDTTNRRVGFAPRT